MDERSVRNAWEKFVVGTGDVKSAVRPEVFGSWQRSKNFSIDAGSQAAPILSDGELYRKRSDNALLTASARLATQRAGCMLREAGSMLILTDGTGHIIETMGDTRTIEFGREVHLEDGGCWSEQQIGTNGIGAALAAKAPSQIHASEHFCEHVQRWTCAAAPIFHPVDRELLGVIDISGPAETFSSQNLALVVSFADHIESLMSQSIRNDHARLMARFQEKQRKWASHDMILVDRRGSIVQSSLDAMRILTMHSENLPETGDLTFLKILPFDQWEGRLARLDSNARIVLVSDGPSELGAMIIFPTKLRQPLPTKGKCCDSSPPPWTIDADQPVEKAGAQNRTAGDRHAVHAKRQAVTPSLPLQSPSVDFVALDPHVKAICSNVAAATRLRLPILICGQTGTGKEKLARYAHTSSGRKGSFVAVNCSALPESLVEAELFGYADGSFTGARKGGSPGLIREAEGGTLFLDEIGDMPFTLQSVLLRFLDDFTVRPIGGTSRATDVLIISATNVDLGLAITSRRFRADLLYRLNTLQVNLPPLSDRTDVEAIAVHLLAKIDPNMRISDAALAALAKRTWQGNARELRSVLARMSMVATDRLISEPLVEAFAPGAPAHTPGKSSLRELQRTRLLEVFSETGGNISETARRLNVCRNTVYKALDAPDGV